MSEIRPLVVIHDETVLDETLKLAAAIGCSVERLPDLTAARSQWLRAPLVLVDEQAANTQPDLPRRAGVLLLKKGSPETETWRLAFSLGAEQVLSLPQDENELVEVLAQTLRPRKPVNGKVLGLLGGRGGAGASVLASGVSFQAARRGPALLLDCDRLGGGIDLLLGPEIDDFSYWPIPDEEDEFISSLSYLDTPRGWRATARPKVISCDREGHVPSSSAVTSVIDSARRSGHLVICDLPRHLDSCARTALDAVDLLVVVVPAEVRACLAARSVIEQAGLNTERTRLVVRGPSPDGLRAEHVAESIGVELLASMPPERGLARAVERGRFPTRSRGPLAATAVRLMDAVHAQAELMVAP
jgi:secretion/DNA translocation related CpaE-like protein